MSKCIIMCAGSFTPIDIDIEDGDLVIAADNGLTHLQTIGIKPDIIVGDFDSLEYGSRSLVDAFEEADPDSVVRLPVEKDDTDAMAAVRIGLQKGYQKFFLYGALGGDRLDHTLANIQTLNFIKSEGAQGYIMDADCMMFILRDETKAFHPGFSGGFSLFALDTEITGVTIRGMKYNVENVTISNHFPIGVSNHIEGFEEASVTVEHGTALCYVRWED